MIDIIKEIAENIQGVFVFQNTSASLPCPLGVEIENELDDVVYLGSELDKWSMYRDRLNVIGDLNVAIKEAKYEQASKTD